MEAYLYEKLYNKKIKCNLCNHRCIVKNGQRGICNVRENNNGIFETLVFNKIIAQNVDPIEKKPIFHLFPGSLSYSIATVGCNFSCRFCQNSDISQMPRDRDGMILGSYDTPRDIVNSAIKYDCKSISYTYTEPTIFFELAYETSKIAHENGLKNIFVTNGYMTKEALDMINPYLDAANVDLKAYNKDFYKDCGAKLEYVKETIKYLKALDILVEVTTLIIPGLNDDENELMRLASFLVNIGSEIPWHVSRFHPTYKLLDRSLTPNKTLSLARDIGIQAGLKYVYTGNIYGDKGENTFCHNCNNILIERKGFVVIRNNIKNNKCPHCSIIMNEELVMRN